MLVKEHSVCSPHVFINGQVADILNCHTGKNKGELNSSNDITVVSSVPVIILNELIGTTGGLKNEFSMPTCKPM